MIISQLRPAIVLLAAISLAMIATIAQADAAGKWRIEFDRYTGNDGAIMLRVSPEGGTPVDVETKIAAKSSPDKVARTVRDSLKVSLGEGYQIETDDGEDVIVKKSGKTPNFDLTLVSSSLLGLSIGIKRE